MSETDLEDEILNLRANFHVKLAEKLDIATTNSETRRLARSLSDKEIQEKLKTKSESKRWWHFRVI